MKTYNIDDLREMISESLKICNDFDYIVSLTEQIQDRQIIVINNNNECCFLHELTPEEIRCNQKISI